MKLLFDNNLSFKLVHPLLDHFPGSQHVKDTLNISADDIDIWNFAKANGFVIITKDNDFDERSQLEGCPPKIIHLICGNKTSLHILNLIIWNREELIKFCESDASTCILKIS